MRYLTAKIIVIMAALAIGWTQPTVESIRAFFKTENKMVLPQMPPSILIASVILCSIMAISSIMRADEKAPIALWQENPIRSQSSLLHLVGICFIAVGIVWTAKSRTLHAPLTIELLPLAAGIGLLVGVYASCYLFAESDNDDKPVKRSLI